MLENHKDKGGSAWEVYSECVREAMARRSGMELDNTQLREKVAYEDLM